MFKLLLAWRYLRTRFIAIASIVSVTLGVATLIVVNSVMSGFSQEMTSKLHGILSDVDISAAGMGEIDRVDTRMSEIAELLGDDLQAATTVVRVPAMVNFLVNGQPRYHQIMLIGIDDQTFGEVTDFRPYLTNQLHRQGPVFGLMENGYDDDLPESGWSYRREKFRHQAFVQQELEKMLAQQFPSQKMDLQLTQQRIGTQPPPAAAPGDPTASQPNGASESGVLAGYQPLPAAPPKLKSLANDVAENAGAEFLDIGDTLTANLNAPAAIEKWQPPIFDSSAQFREPMEIQEFDPITEQRVGIILGIGIGKIRAHDPSNDQVRDVFFLRPGDDVELTVPSAGAQPKPILENCTLVDFYSSKMHEYDSAFAFMPLSHLQRIRGMYDMATGGSTVSSIQLKLRPGADLIAVRDRLRVAYPPMYHPLIIQTWRDQQAPLLSAVEMEITILNILLFMIIAVAGFGILATFFMIVVEKTKDIGILKSLGAPSGGVMSIFLAYGLSLGFVGAGVGTILGLMFVWYINEIADLVAYLSGREVFDPAIYYFSEIPTQLSPMMVLGVAIGAMLIAVLSSVLPAMRAARLDPVDALRYE